MIWPDRRERLLQPVKDRAGCAGVRGCPADSDVLEVSWEMGCNGKERLVKFVAELDPVPLIHSSSSGKAFHNLELVNLFTT